MSDRAQSSLTNLARIGFSRLDAAAGQLDELAELVGVGREELLADAASAADPDEALAGLLRIALRRSEVVSTVLRHPHGRRVAWRLLGASRGFAEESLEGLVADIESRALG